MYSLSSDPGLSLLEDTIEALGPGPRMLWMSSKIPRNGYLSVKADCSASSTILMHAFTMQHGVMEGTSASSGTDTCYITE